MAHQLTHTVVSRLCLKKWWSKQTISFPPLPCQIVDLPWYGLIADHKEGTPTGV